MFCFNMRTAKQFSRHDSIRRRFLLTLPIQFKLLTKGHLPVSNPLLPENGSWSKSQRRARVNVDWYSFIVDTAINYFIICFHPVCEPQNV